MKGLIRPLILATAATLCVPGISALDLPTKTINGKEYYYYAVQRSDTLLGVAKKLGVTREDITNYNPSAADGLRQGTTIYLPVSKFASVESPASEAPTQSRATFAYKVKKGETLFGLSHRFGVTPDEIIAHNPSANDGIKAGEILIIPGSDDSTTTAETASSANEQAVETAAEVETTAATAKTKTKSTTITAAADEEEELPITTGERRLRPVEPNYTLVSDDDKEQVDTANIAIVLPLMLDEETQGKNAKSATEFVRGFMMGLRQYSGSAVPSHVNVYDSKGSVSEIATIMSKPQVSNADIIIAPDDAASYAATVAGLGDSDAFLLNLFAVQDTIYMHDARIMQANVPHKLMYEKAAEGLVTIYDGYTPVFIISKGGKSDKIAFTDYLRQQFADNDIQSLEIIFDGMLTQADLGDLDPESKYVFIPTSGTLTEFNKFAKTLITYRDNTASNPTNVAVFGYPDWTTFRGEAKDNLHKVGATIYSRFYADANSGEVKGFESEFKETYGVAPIEHVPSQALLGYDTACYLMDNLRRNGGALDADAPSAFHGLQSSFKFNAVENVGPVNQVVYIITFLPGEYVDVKIY